MLSLPEIEKAVDSLTTDQKRELHRYLEDVLRGRSVDPSRRHSVLDIPPVRLGAILRPFANGDDLLAEMLEERK